jgi:hypothetical protein
MCGYTCGFDVGGLWFVRFFVLESAQEEAAKFVAASPASLSSSLLLPQTTHHQPGVALYLFFG